MNDITLILERLDQGQPQAASDLLALLYGELKRIAANQLAREKPGNTLQATALVHEAWLRLVVQPLAGQGKEPRFSSRKRFFHAAAVAMRRILVDRARSKRAKKRGSGATVFPLNEALATSPQEESLVELDEALDRFAQKEPVKAQVVELRYFAGLSMPQIAETLDLSLATVERHWAFARAWLYTELTRGEADAPAPDGR